MRFAWAALACAFSTAAAATGPASEPEPPESVRKIPPAARKLLDLANDAVAHGQCEVAMAHLDTLVGLLGSDHWLKPRVDEMAGFVETSCRPAPPAEEPPPPAEAAPPPPAPAAGQPPPEQPAPIPRPRRRTGWDITELYIHTGQFAWWAGFWFSMAQARLDEEWPMLVGALCVGPGILAAYLLDNVPEQKLRAGTIGGIDTGIQWGTYWTVLTALAFDDRDFSDELLTWHWTGGLLGAAAGGALAEVSDASRGQVSMVYSGAFWGAFLVPFVAGSLIELRDRQFSRLMLWGSLGGAVATAASAIELDPSRGRVLVIDLAGIMGAATGGLFNVFSDAATDQAVFAAEAVGIIAGLTIGVLATSDFDADRKPPAEGDAARVWTAPTLLSTEVGASSRSGLVPGIVAGTSW